MCVTENALEEDRGEGSMRSARKEIVQRFNFMSSHREISG